MKENDILFLFWVSTFLFGVFAGLSYAPNVLPKKIWYKKI